jgi:hypothetical protein
MISSHFGRSDSECFYGALFSSASRSCGNGVVARTINNIMNIVDRYYALVLVLRQSFRPKLWITPGIFLLNLPSNRESPALTVVPASRCNRNNQIRLCPDIFLWQPQDLSPGFRRRERNRIYREWKLQPEVSSWECDASPGTSRIK